MGNFQKLHNTLVCPSKIFHKYCFHFSRATIVSPRRKWKQCLCKILEGPTKSIIVFLKVAYLFLEVNRTSDVSAAYWLSQPHAKNCGNFSLELIRFFSVVEISIKHSSLYNKSSLLIPKRRYIYTTQYTKLVDYH